MFGANVAMQCSLSTVPTSDGRFRAVRVAKHGFPRFPRRARFVALEICLSHLLSLECDTVWCAYVFGSFSRVKIFYTAVVSYHGMAVFTVSLILADTVRGMYATHRTDLPVTCTR